MHVPYPIPCPFSIFLMQSSASGVVLPNVFGRSSTSLPACGSGDRALGNGRTPRLNADARRCLIAPDSAGLGSEAKLFFDCLSAVPHLANGCGNFVFGFSELLHPRTGCGLFG
jgi:hypothetical protein